MESSVTGWARIRIALSVAYWVGAIAPCANTYVITQNLHSVATGPLLLCATVYGFLAMAWWVLADFRRFGRPDVATIRDRAKADVR